MHWGTVPAANIAAMAVTAAASIGVPIILLFCFRKRNGWVPAFLIGCGVFIVFVLVLEQLFHAWMRDVFGIALQTRTYLYALYGGLTATLFEETGRWIAFRYFLKKHQDTPTALMYGAGHGGAESILIVGLSYINHLAAAVMINTGATADTVSAMEENMQEAVYTQLSLLWTSSAGTFLLAGAERMSAIVLQLSFSMLVYMAVKKRKASYWGMAFVVHCLVDSAAVILADALPGAVTEIIIAAMAVITVFCVYRLYQKHG